MLLKARGEADASNRSVPIDQISNAGTVSTTVANKDSHRQRDSNNIFSGKKSSTQQLSDKSGQTNDSIGVESARVDSSKSVAIGKTGGTPVLTPKTSTLVKMPKVKDSKGGETFDCKSKYTTNTLQIHYIFKTTV